MSSYIGEIRIGKDYQATLPSYLGPYPATPSTEGVVNCEQPAEEDSNNCGNSASALPEHGADMVWNPKSITDDNLIMFLRAARSVTAFAGMCRKKGPNKEDGASVVSRDDTTQRYFDILHENEYDVNQTLDILGKEPLPNMWEKEWTHEEAKCFSRAIKIIGKEFNRVRDEYLKHKRTKDLIQFYYFWKKSPYNPSRNQRRNRRNRKSTNPPNTGSSNNNNSKAGSNSKSNNGRLPNPPTDQIKMEDGGAVPSIKLLENINTEPSLPPSTPGSSSPGRLNAKSSAPPTTMEVEDNLFDNDDIPLLNLVKVARGLAGSGPVPTQASNNTTNLGPETGKEKSDLSVPKEATPKEVVENDGGQNGPVVIKMEDVTRGETDISNDPILPEAIVLDEGIAAPRITLATTSPSCNLGPNNTLYEIPLSDIGTIKSEILPVQSNLESKLDGTEKSNDNLSKSPAPLSIVISTSLNQSASRLECPASSPVANRASTPEPFVPVRSSVLVPTPSAFIKNLRPPPDVKRGDRTPPPIAERSASSSPEISESEIVTTNAQPENDHWLGEKLFRNGNMYRYIKRVDGSSCARTDLAFVYQKLPFHYPPDLELSQGNNDLHHHHVLDPSPNQIIPPITTTTAIASTITSTGGPFAAGKINRTSNSKAPTAVASILPIPCPPKSRSPLTTNKFLQSHNDEIDRMGLAGAMGGTFPPSGPPSFWYPQGAGQQQPFMFTPPPLHLAQASAALLPYFMAAAASGAFAPPFALPAPPLAPLGPPSYEPPEALSAGKSSTPQFAKGNVARHDHQQQKNHQRAQESGQEYTRSSAVKNGYNHAGAKTLSASPFRGGPFSNIDTFESSSPYYAYLSSQQQQQQLQQQRAPKPNAMGLVRASPPNHPYPPPARKGLAPFTPWASRPSPHPGIYEYPPPAAASVKRKNCGGAAHDSTLERKKTPALEGKSNASSSRGKLNSAKFGAGPYSELAAFNPHHHHPSLGIGANPDSSGHPSLQTHHPSLPNGGPAGQPGKTPPVVNRSKISAVTTLGPTSMPLDPFYYHRAAHHQQHLQAGAGQARPPGPFEFNPFFTGPAMVSSAGPNHPYHLPQPPNFHPGLMRGFRAGTNFNPFPPIPEEIMAAAAAQHQYQLLQQHSYFSNPFSPNILPSVLQQQDRNDTKRE